MVSATHISFRADDRSYYSIIKKDIHSMVLEGGYSTRKIAEIDLIVSEMTSNLSKYATDGEILFGSFRGQTEYVEILCIDGGPGISDLSRMMNDGISTTSTLGHGLGSISRLSDVFDIYSVKNWGTIVLSRVYKNAIPVKTNKPLPDIHPIVISKPGEKVSGDGTYYESTPNYLKMLVADGLGHGEEANKAVNAAVEAFKEYKGIDPADTIRSIHHAIRRTRGIVATVLFYSLETKTWKFAGVGNISLKLCNHVTAKSYMSYNGIIGHNIPNTMKVQEFTNSDFNHLILCSDGIKSRWDLANLPAINKHDPSIQAAAVYKNFGRKTDDMSVVFIKSN